MKLITVKIDAHFANKVSLKAGSASLRDEIKTDPVLQLAEQREQQDSACLIE